MRARGRAKLARATDANCSAVRIQVWFRVKVHTIDLAGNDVIVHISFPHWPEADKGEIVKPFDWSTAIPDRSIEVFGDYILCIFLR